MTRKSFFLGMLAVPIPYLALLLDSGSGILYRDLSNVYIPLKAEWARAVSQLHRLPEWDPFHAGGLPFLADPSYGPLYPLNPLFLLFGAENTPRALVWFILLHHLLLYTGGYLLAKELRVRPALCILGGLAFAWCGFAMSADNLLHLLGAQVAVPFFLVFWRRSLRNERAGVALALASMAFVWPIYAGDPQFTFVLAAAAALFAIHFPLPRVALRLAQTAALAAIAAGPQLLPVLRVLAAQSARLMQAAVENQTAWSLPPQRLLELLVPLAFTPLPGSGSLAGLGLENGLQPRSYPFIFSSYVGATLAACLLAYLPLHFAKRRRLRARHAVLAGTFSAVLLLTLGSRSPIPLYSFFHRFVPLWNVFRYPERLSYWLSLPLLAASLVAAERLLRLRRMPAGAMLFSASVVLLASALTLPWYFANGYFPQGALHATAFSVAALLVLKLRPHRAAGALALIAAFDFGLSASRLVWPQSLEITRTENLPTAVEVLREFTPEKLSRGEPRRLLSLFELAGVNPAALEHLSILSLDSAQAWLGLSDNLPAFLGVEGYTYHGSIAPKRSYLPNPCHDSPCRTRVAELLSVRGVLLASKDGPKLTGFPSALPFASFPSEIAPAGTREEAFGKALVGDPHRTAFLSAATETGLIAWRVEHLDRSWDRMRLELSTEGKSGRALLLLSEAFDPGWTAKLAGGEPLEIREANGWSLSVKLPEPGPSHHLEVELSYRDPAFRYGLALFALWLGITLWLSIRSATGAATGARQVRV